MSNKVTRRAALQRNVSIPTGVDDAEAIFYIIGFTPDLDLLEQFNRVKLFLRGTWPDGSSECRVTAAADEDLKLVHEYLERYAQKDFEGIDRVAAELLAAQHRRHERSRESGPGDLSGRIPD